MFIDANCLVYAATSDPQYGAACQRLLERIENKLLQGCTSAHVLGDLRRAAKEDLERLVPGAIQVRNPGSGWGAELANRQSDLSESLWFYLLFLAILVIEQALAVHLSSRRKRPA